MVECSAHNRLVAGSSPAGTIIVHLFNVTPLIFKALINYSKSFVSISSFQILKKERKFKMEPIISLWIFYFIDLLTKLQAVLLLFVALSLSVVLLYMINMYSDDKPENEYIQIRNRSKKLLHVY